MNSKRLTQITLALILSFFSSCSHQSSEKEGRPTQTQSLSSISDIDHAPEVVDADKKYADAFKLLDGHWKGGFMIFVDQRGQQEGQAELLSIEQLRKSEDFSVSLELQVDQWYTSESPYFQRVKVRDVYPDGKIEESVGVNKVQDGKLFCIVKKPTDLVIHDGRLDGRDTIIWTRSRKTPKAVEYFRESVSEDSYVISGYGYYGDEDLDKKPRMHFYAEYKKIK